MTAWHDAFLACAGAGATLAGLIIVAMSVNIGEIVTIPAMPARAGSAIASLVQVVLITVAALLPGQPLFALGIETLVVTVVATALHADAAVRLVRLGAADATRFRTASNLGLLAIQVVPFFVAGVLLCCDLSSGLYWVVAGSLLVFVGSIVNAWVLLVEIRR